MDALKFSQLEYFCAVVEEGSVTAAARKMKCVVSNITSRVKELETLLNQPLFLREKGRLLPSPEGRLFYQEARSVIDNTQKLARFFEPDTIRGVLRIGTLDVALKHYLLKRVPIFLSAHPGVDINLLQRPTFTLETMLNDGQIDIALSDGPVVHPLLDSCFAYEEPLSLIAPPDMPTAGSINWAETTLFLFNTDCFYRRHVENWLARHRLPIPPIHTIESYPLIRACVAAGLGVSCFPRSMQDMASKGDVHVIDVDIDPSPVYIMWRRGGLSSAGRHFIDCVTGIQDEPNRLFQNPR